MERIYSLNVRLISRLLMKSVKEESDQALAARLWRAARGAGRLATTHVRAKRILKILLSLFYQFVYII
jgi:hypothetical protein